MHGLVRLLEHLLHGGKGSIPELAPAVHQLTQLEQAQSQAESGGGPLQQPPLDQQLREPVHRRLRDRRPGRQLGQSKLRFLGGKAVQQRKHTFEDGLRSGPVRGHVHLVHTTTPSGHQRAESCQLIVAPPSSMHYQAIRPEKGRRRSYR